MKMLINQIAQPLVHRLGTYVGGTLTALGMSATDVNIVVTALPVIMGFGVDLVVRKAFR